MKTEKRTYDDLEHIIYISHSEKIKNILTEYGLNDQEIVRTLFYIQFLSAKIILNTNTKNKIEDRSTYTLKKDGFDKSTISKNLTYTKMTSYENSKILTRKNYKKILSILEELNIIHINHSYCADGTETFSKKVSFGDFFFDNIVEDFEIKCINWSELESNLSNGLMNRTAKSLVAFLKYKIEQKMLDEDEITKREYIQLQGDKGKCRVLETYADECFVNTDEINLVFKKLSKNPDLSPFEKMQAITRFTSILNGLDYATIDEAGRLHYPYTTIHKELRELVKFSEYKEVVSVDIKCSQPTLLTTILEKIEGIDKVELTQFKDACTGKLDKDVYEIMAKKLDITRSEAKPIVLSVIYGSVKVESKNMLQFKECFPSVYKAIRKFKYKLALEINTHVYGTDKQQETIISDVFEDCNVSSCILFKNYDLIDDKLLSGHRLIGRYIDYNNENMNLNEFSKKIFSRLLQSIEAKIVFKTIGDLIDKKGSIPVLTVHDSIKVPKEFINDTTELFTRNAIEMYGIDPKLEIE